MSRTISRALSSLSLAGPSTPSASLPAIAHTTPQAVKSRRTQALLNAHPTIDPSRLRPLTNPSQPLPGRYERKFQLLRSKGRFEGDEPSARIAFWESRVPTAGNTVPEPADEVSKPSQALPPRLEAEFQALRAKGQYKGDEASGRKAFWDGQVKWRSRLRGVTVIGGKQGFMEDLEKARQGESDTGEGESAVDENGEQVDKEGKLVANRIYLPNIQIRLMRNHTPPNTAYDPYLATFRIPHSMTKTDLRSYLQAVYNLPVTFIRTDNYFAPVKRIPGGRLARAVGSQKSYKRAVVGLTEPFHYPDDVDEMYAQGEANGMGKKMGDARKAWVEENFQVEVMKEYRKRALMKLHKGYRWRSKTHDNGGNTIREIMKKRLEQEGRITEEVAKMHREGEATAAV